MKQLLFILILGLGVTTSSPAQYYFNERNAVHSFNSAITSIQALNEKYYCTGFCVDSINIDTAYSGVKFLIYSETGDLLKDTIYQLPSKNIEAWSNDLYVLSDSTFLLSAFDQALDESYRGIIMELDTGGRVKWEKEYDQPFCSDYNWYKTQDLKPTGDNHWLMLSIIACRTGGITPDDFVLTKLDSNFNIIWNKRYGDPGTNDVPYKILVEPDGYILAGGWNDETTIMPHHTFNYRAQIIKTDTGGNEQWVWKSDSLAIINNIQDILKTQDKGYVYCGSRFTVGEGWQGWIEKTDSDRNVLWNDTIGYFPTDAIYTDQTVLKELNNGDLVMAGVISGGFDTTHTAIPGIENYGSLVRVTSNGIIKWERQYNIPNDTFLYQIFDMKQTFDKGYILGGDAVDYRPDRIDPVQRTWIIKVDSNGCMSPTDPQCHPVSVRQLLFPNAAIRVFPNPVKNTLKISYDHLPDAQFILTDIAGKTIAQCPVSTTGTKILDVSYLSPGLYLYKVIANNMVIDVGKVVKE